MLKALGFQLLELFESKVPFKVVVSTANLHPYTKAFSLSTSLGGVMRGLEVGVELKVRRFRLTLG